jgi:hypothetical protein
MDASWWWLYTERMTVVVRVDNGLVVEAPPIVRKFIGQPQENLLRWLSFQPGFRLVQLD